MQTAEFKPEQWAEVVRDIESGGDRLQEGIEALYSALTLGARGRLIRAAGAQSIEDRIHEVLIIVLEAIQRGELREPERLMGFAATVARRRAVAHIRGVSFERRRFVAVDVLDAQSYRQRVDQNPEASLARCEKLERAERVLRTLCTRDREILSRFYFEEQTPAVICAAMGLSATQFRLFKSRAIARCFLRSHGTSGLSQ